MCALRASKGRCGALNYWVTLIYTGFRSVIYLQKKRWRALYFTLSKLYFTLSACANSPRVLVKRAPSTQREVSLKEATANGWLSVLSGGTTLMLDYRQQRDGLNRDCSDDRRRAERRCCERRTTGRRQPERRGSVARLVSTRSESAAQERRKDDRRQLSRRSGDRRTSERRSSERRSDPSRIQRFPQPDGGFLTKEEREFLSSMMRNRGEL